MFGFQQPRIPSDHFFVAISRTLREAAIDVSDVAFEIGDQHGYGALFNRDRQLPQRVFIVLALGNVVKRPDPAIVMAIRTKNGRGVAVEHAPVAQLDFIASFFLPVRVKVLHSFQEAAGVSHFPNHIFQHETIVLGSEEFRRYFEDFADPFVMQKDVSMFVDHQHAVDRGLNLGFEKCGLGSQLIFCSFSRCDVGTDDQQFATSTVGNLDPSDGHTQKAGGPGFLELHSVPDQPALGLQQIGDLGINLRVQPVDSATRQGLMQHVGLFQAEGLRRRSIPPVDAPLVINPDQNGRH